VGAVALGCGVVLASPRLAVGGREVKTPRVLSVERLSKRFGALSVLDSISFQVRERERRAIIGPNGAGKTTLFNLITGHLAPSEGRILFDGTPVHGLAPHAVARRGISRSFQRTSLFRRLTVLENLRLAAGADGKGSYRLFGRIESLSGPLTKAREVAGAVGLSARLHDQVEHLSYGEQRQLEIGVALATAPRLLLLDEPTAGMSPEETVRMTQLIESLPREVGLLVIEHDMSVVSSLADHVTVLHHGQVLAEGTFAEVKANPLVYDVYLGHE
jgi:branched-chain amino acid transport system ATP-binding protein